jgi:ABC-2 type transport system permease protein
MNIYAIRAIYKFELARTWRTLMQSIASPVISTSLYFVVFGSAIGAHMVQIDGVSYGAFIVPGLIMLALLTESISAAATKSVILGVIILITARFFVAYHILHPLWMIAFLFLTAITFSLFGFIIGIWADGFEKLQIVPAMIVTPLTFLGGSFYSISMLPPLWQKVTLFNPVVYLISGFRWSFYGVADVHVGISVGMTLVFMALCLAVIGWIFKTGYRLKN